MKLPEVAAASSLVVAMVDTVPHPIRDAAIGLVAALLSYATAWVLARVKRWLGG